MSIFDFLYLIYIIKQYYNMPKKIKTKVELSISLDGKLLEYIKDNYKNRSKFIEYCIIEELNRYNIQKEI